MRVTEQLLRNGQSDNGGWSKAQLALLGIPWPLKHGWKATIIGTTISEDTAKRFLSARKGGIAPPLF